MWRSIWKLLGIILSLVFTLSFIHAQAPIELTENFASGNSKISFDYPEGWYVVELYEGGLDIANNQEMLLQRDSPEVGQIKIGVFTSVVLENKLSVSTDASLETVMDAFVSPITAFLPPPLPEYVTEQVGDKSILRMSIEDEEGHTSLFAVPTDDEHFVMLVLDALPSDAEDYIPTVLAVAETMAFYEPDEITPLPYTFLNLEASIDDLTQKYQSDDTKLTFSIPAGWIVEESQMSIIVANREDVDFPQPDPDEVILLITVANQNEAENLPEEANPLDFIRTLRTPLHNLPVTFTINGIEAAYSGIRRIPDQPNGAMMVIEPTPGIFVSIMAFVASGEWPDFEDTVLGILSTIEYTVEE